MDKPRTTAKDFFLWAGAVVSLYWTIIAYTMLVFDYINYAFPDMLRYYPANPYESGISAEMASVIVMLPLFVLLRSLIRRDAKRDPSRNEIWVRRWAIIFTLFLAGIAMAGDLITLLTTFLNGSELTVQFLLKVLTIFLVAAALFMHFIADLWGYWEQYPSRKRAVVIGVAVLAVATILSGFVIVGTPGEARKARFDAERVTDLQDLQSRVTRYWQAKQTLPTTIDALSDSINFGPLPTDPETHAPYVYRATGTTTFQLCTTFKSATPYSQRTAPISFTGVDTTDPSSWQHAAGPVCFNRTIDPAFYPPSPTRI